MALHPSLKAPLAVAVVAASLAACGDDPLQPDQVDVTIAFAALVDGTDFACGQSYAGIGTMDTEITPTDFRFYVHDVMLTSASGAKEPVALEDDGTWQRDGLALLDFENGAASCVNGTTATNTTLRGTVADGDYTGITFVLGVPQGMNHVDQTVAAAPQDVTGLFWSWNRGFKFARIDHTSADQPGGWNVHLGSTGCTPSGDDVEPATACANEHRPTIALSGFDWESDEITADYGALLAGSDLTDNEGAPGCMSGSADPECGPVMSRFGLTFDGTPSSGQSFFGIR